DRQLRPPRHLRAPQDGAEDTLACRAVVDCRAAVARQRAGAARRAAGGRRVDGRNGDQPRHASRGRAARRWLGGLCHAAHPQTRSCTVRTRVHRGRSRAASRQRERSGSRAWHPTREFVPKTAPPERRRPHRSGHPKVSFAPHCMNFLTVNVNVPIVTVRFRMLPAFRRLVVSTLIAAIVLPAGLLEAAPLSGARAALGTISGSARHPSGQLLPNVAVRVRNLQTGQLEAAMNAGLDGQFSFSALGPGLYTVEIVNAAGQVVSTTAPVLLTAAATSATGVTATTSAAAQGGGGAGSFWTSGWGIVSIAAIGAG